MLYRELQEYQREGIPLWLNGKPSTSYRIAQCVCEHTDYMRDYHTDGQNRVCGIGFDKVRKDLPKSARSPFGKNLKYCEEFLKKSKYVRSEV